MDHRAAGSPRRNTFVMPKTLSCFDLAVHTFCPTAANFRLNHEKSPGLPGGAGAVYEQPEDLFDAVPSRWLIVAVADSRAAVMRCRSGASAAGGWPVTGA
ncbi:MULTISPECIES: hypothetical protein [Micromonospora]|uniref:hypothetical protein n=1 Tax=Micromonospora TaxID=1873 RepID=UPI001E32D5C1|nr:hypothetical protein [Micromonospora sp. NBRC 110038]